MKAIQQLDPDARTLAEFLSTLSPGDTASYEDLAACVNRDVRRADRHVLYRAMELAKRDYQAVFVCVRTYGVKRLPPNEVPNTIGTHTTRRIRRMARRAVRTIRAGTSGKEISPDAKRSLITHCSVFGSLLLATAPRKLKQIEAKAAPDLSLKRYLAALVAQET